MSRPMALAGVGAALLFIACTTPPNVARPPAPPPAPVKRDSVAPPPAREWAIHRATGTWRFKVESNATVVLASDSTSPAAPIHSMAIYSLSVDSADASGYRIAGRVDSAMLSTGGRVPARPVDSTVSEFSAQIDSLSGLTNEAMNSGERPTCAGGVTPVVAAALTLFVTVPSRVQQGAVWHDSTTTTTCRGTVAVVSKLDRTFQLSDTTTWNGQSVLRVNVTATSTIEGQGLASAAGDSIWVSGTGTSSGMLLLDPTSMMPVSSTMTGNSDVTVRSLQTTLPFKQQVADTATMLDHRAGTTEP
jgi:hypothetical protein